MWGDTEMIFQGTVNTFLYVKGKSAVKFNFSNRNNFKPSHTEIQCQKTQVDYRQLFLYV